MKSKIIVATLVILVVIISVFALVGCGKLNDEEIENKEENVDSFPSDTGNLESDYTLEFKVNADSSTCSVFKIHFKSGKEVEKVVIPKENDNRIVAGIMNKAFEKCLIFNTIELPESITKIGDSAFEGCSNLKEINLPGSLVSIGSRAFADCKSLNKIVLPSNLESIGDSAFENCSNLTSISVPDSLKNLGENIFASCNITELSIPLKLIERVDITKVTNLTISSGEIGAEMFQRNNTLEQITIGSGVKVVGESAFTYCDNLKKIIVNEGVKRIESNSFSHCENLTSITIPASVENIGERTFGYNVKLEEIQISEENIVYKSEGNCILSKDGQALILGCKKSEIPQGVVEIKSYAFAKCTELTEITIPNSVEKIESNAFVSCKNIKRIYYQGTQTEWDNIEKETSWISNMNIEILFVQNDRFKRITLKINLKR